ncbi:MAG TPA: hypothetical protein VFW05_15650 [Verrucomicrobiae bacterium]|nr:hypothetical protein [Verrucomicrobiae bacterium]
MFLPFGWETICDALNMFDKLNSLTTSLEGGVLRKGSRVFAVLGKATPAGIAAFRREDIGRSWAVTAEFGCLRLERLTGEEEVTSFEIFLTTPFSYDYGISGTSGTADLTRSVFGLLPSELEQLVTTLRRGSFPVLGFSPGDTKCCLTSSLIPGCWPHVVISNLALYGNVISVEAFVRTLISSMPQGHLSARFPMLQPVLKHLLRLMIVQRRGLPYCNELLELSPLGMLAAK